jgi:metal-responsive CopG/Arc/MetJ family transcriptional regulator
MSSRIVCVRIPQPLATELTTFCATRGEQPSTVIRDALRDLLAHPERYADLVVARASYAFEDLRSEMAQALEQAGEAPEAFDVAEALAALRVPGA